MQEATDSGHGRNAGLSQVRPPRNALNAPAEKNESRLSGYRSPQHALAGWGRIGWWVGESRQTCRVWEGLDWGRIGWWVGESRQTCRVWEGLEGLRGNHWRAFGARSTMRRALPES